MARLVTSGAEIERATAGQSIDRHHHEGAYAALVLRGGYLEAGDRGRFRARPGDVVFHAAFDGHCNCISGSGAEILNIQLRAAPPYALGVCADPDGVTRMAERNLRDAEELLLAKTSPRPVPAFDWPDELADDLRRDRVGRLDSWAGRFGLSPSQLSRGFGVAYGVSPKRFRLELRAAAAARAISLGTRLSEAAVAAGFADQPHMTRTIAALFGRPPGQFRN